MGVEEQFRARYPGVFFLDSKDLAGLTDHLRRLGWMGAGEKAVSASRAGEGNMNYTLRVITQARSFVLKQARPWVEKYSHIPAPWDRALSEAEFYEMVSQNEELAAAMPHVLGVDRKSRLIMMEDLGESRDFTFLYAGGAFEQSDAGELTEFALKLHSAVDGSLVNLEMRRLNHEHIFVLPLRDDNGLDLDAITPGLQAAAERLKRDAAFRSTATTLGVIYLSDGRSLLHGDYFPGSWLQTEAGVKVIDPEFGFFGAPEFDAGVMLGHMHLARVNKAQTDGILSAFAGSGRYQERVVRQFAGIEIMRRLIGVAQLPLGYGIDEKSRLLELARALVLN